MFNQLSRDIHTTSASKKLSDIITSVPVAQIYGPIDAPVAGITTDSRKVNSAWIFVATEGENVDGHNFIQQAIEKHASVVVIQIRQYEEYLSRLLTSAYAQHTQTTVVVVQDTRIAVAALAAAYYDFPATKMKMIGITGTNGKTTTSYLIKSILNEKKEKVGIIGTIGYEIGDEVIPASLTTPLAEDIQQMLRMMVERGCTYCVMEVSSHALALKRVAGMMFDVSVYTNLSRDHLDFHGSFEKYAEEKAKLFREHSSGIKVLNSDDQYQLVMWDSTDEGVVTYGKQNNASIRIESVESTAKQTSVMVINKGKTVSLTSQLAGKFNAYNITAAYCVCKILNINDDVIQEGITSLASVPGRFERVDEDGITAFVDYSHTPDSLEKALISARELLKHNSKLIVVFGCGGNRDKGKRPLMGSIAEKNADIVIVTNDNPRQENPESIINDVLAGINDKNNVQVIQSRAKAIEEAITVSVEGDVIVIAGKGHENYQIIGSEKTHFDDVEEVRKAFFRKHEGSL